MATEIDHNALARKINQALGAEVIWKMYEALTPQEFNYLQGLMLLGQVCLHEDQYAGITINTPEGWTSEGF